MTDNKKLNKDSKKVNKNRKNKKVVKKQVESSDTQDDVKQVESSDTQDDVKQVESSDTQDDVKQVESSDTQDDVKQVESKKKSEYIISSSKVINYINNHHVNKKCFEAIDKVNQFNITDEDKNSITTVEQLFDKVTISPFKEILQVENPNLNLNVHGIISNEKGVENFKELILNLIKKKKYKFSKDVKDCIRDTIEVFIKDLITKVIRVCLENNDKVVRTSHLLLATEDELYSFFKKSDVYKHIQFNEPLYFINDKSYDFKHYVGKICNKCLSLEKEKNNCNNLSFSNEFKVTCSHVINEFLFNIGMGICVELDHSDIKTVNKRMYYKVNDFYKIYKKY